MSIIAWTCTSWPSGPVDRLPVLTFIQGSAFVGGDKALDRAPYFKRRGGGVFHPWGLVQ